MLTVRDICKRYEGAPLTAYAVDHVNLDIAAGEFFTLLGPSGCGKTSTLRSLAGLETPDKGEILIGGKIVYSSSKQISRPVNERDISMVFQSYAVWPHMTVAGNVRFPLDSAGMAAASVSAEVARVLDMVGLAGFADRPASLLSGGQQQRVALARAIVKPANVLLLDEPLSNLDAKLRQKMREELRDLQQKIGRTSVYVTHDQEEALALSDRIALMAQGKVVELGTPEQLYNNPRSAFTARFLGHTDLLAATVESRSDTGATLQTAFGRLHVGRSVNTDAAKVQVLVRPERVRFVDGAAAVENQFTGMIKRRTYTGRSSLYEIEVAQGLMYCDSTNLGYRSVGDTVVIHVPAEHCIVVPFEATI